MRPVVFYLSKGSGEGPYKPHIAYACGGIWSDDGSGYWNGRCWAPKKQLELQLQEEA